MLILLFLIVIIIIIVVAFGVGIFLYRKSKTSTSPPAPIKGGRCPSDKWQYGLNECCNVKPKNYDEKKKYYTVCEASTPSPIKGGRCPNDKWQYDTDKCCNVEPKNYDTTKNYYTVCDNVYIPEKIRASVQFSKPTTDIIIVQSSNKQYKLLYQADGNLVWYDGSNPIKSTNTAGIPQTVLAFQGDGNLVIYGTTGSVWAIGNSQGTEMGPYDLIAQNDGNLVIYGKNGPTHDILGYAPNKLFPCLLRNSTVYKGCGNVYGKKEQAIAQCGSIESELKLIPDGLPNNNICNLSRTTTVYEACGNIYGKKEQALTQCGSVQSELKWIGDGL